MVPHVLLVAKLGSELPRKRREELSWGTNSSDGEEGGVELERVNGGEEWEAVGVNEDLPGFVGSGLTTTSRSLFGREGEVGGKGAESGKGERRAFVRGRGARSLLGKATPLVLRH